mmetsp:Transcript_17398/g.29273  ORF Transcript_17398/g.29273 Transcript_17398/m.29273 type:complete len:414 (+) Transcript_17398:1215-2456(+)
MLVLERNEKLAVYQLVEMEHNIKIQNLLKKGLFQEAQNIALSANFPRETYAEICKEHADQLYNVKKEYDQAIEQYLQTIGFLNPSYVIQRYIEVQQLPNLIKYLEKLIETPTVQSKQVQSVYTAGDYNKDYTALLLNCYVKVKQKDKITELIKKSEQQHKGESIFDIDTAIEVCRQQKETLDVAEALAEKSKNYKLLVQIQIENKRDNEAALETIDKKINNLKEKVQCLQQYVPKLLKASNDSSQIAQKKKRSKEILQIVKDIAKALIEYTKFKKQFKSEMFSQFELKPHQKVKIEDLLQIFVDDLDEVKDFLTYIIDEFGQKFSNELEQLTQINLYHRLLEYMLYSRQIKNQRISVDSHQMKSQIINFIGRYDQKIDHNYVLFLFQIYNFSEGVKECCERLDMKQELLNYYI